MNQYLCSAFRGTLVTLICLTGMLRAEQQTTDGVPSAGQNAKQKHDVLDTTVTHIGSAEAKSVGEQGFYPTRQPDVYWHGGIWKVDLVMPATDDAPYSVSIRSSTGATEQVALPDAYAQVDSLTVTKNDKMIVRARCGGTCLGFVIIDMAVGKIIDDIGVENMSVSPNGRFIAFDDGYTPFADDNTNSYHVYDTMRSPRENICGFRKNDPKHAELDEGLRGLLLYPKQPGQKNCVLPENNSFNGDNVGWNFVWSDDSERVVFADLKSGVLSLILVTMPATAADMPETSVYSLLGAENVCEGATDSGGGAACDYSVVKSIAFGSESIEAVFRRQGPGVDFEQPVTVPFSKFVEIGK